MQQENEILVSTAYLPPITYVARLLQARRIVFDHHAHYIKQTYRNRCRIATANGMQELIVPVIKIHGNHTKLKDIQIAYSDKWQLIHLRALKAAYSKAPYYLYYGDEMERIISTKYDTLVELNGALLGKIFEMLQLDFQFEVSDSYPETIEPGITDLRNVYSPKIQPAMQNAPYPQVFIDKLGFIPGLSIIDLLFNLGPDATAYLENN